MKFATPALGQQVWELSLRRYFGQRGNVLAFGLDDVEDVHGSETSYDCSLTCVLFSLNLSVCNIASKLPPRCAASRARTCIQRNEPYESAWDGRVLILVFVVISKCGYRRSLYTDSSRIPTPH
jgi:hypothetical protein